MKRIVLTAGEPAGIGPELCIMAAQRRWSAQLVVLSDPEMLLERARILGLPLELIDFAKDQPITPNPVGSLTVQPIYLPRAVTPGILNVHNANHILEMLTTAVDGCMQGDFAAMVNAPVHRGIIHDAGYALQDQVDFILRSTAQANPVRLFLCEGIRVALATSHIPLREVTQVITPSYLEQIIRSLVKELTNQFHIQQPRILICGLNPHAGEHGTMGREELDVIIPIVQKLQTEGMALEGPLSAEQAFSPRWLDSCDAVLAMYHDQGLTVLKHRSSNNTVNITLGLPIKCTSVDHGPALDIAGTGSAEAGSFYSAIDTAIALAG